VCGTVDKTVSIRLNHVECPFRIDHGLRQIDVFQAFVAGPFLELPEDLSLSPFPAFQQ
tara:strand:+ start:241012 stop:241185 length:174 start_codon:yes stop_codon:yes gene_type:complete